MVDEQLAAPAITSSLLEESVTPLPKIEKTEEDQSPRGSFMRLKQEEDLNSPKGISEHPEQDPEQGPEDQLVDEALVTKKSPSLGDSSHDIRTVDVRDSHSEGYAADASYMNSPYEHGVAPYPYGHVDDLGIHHSDSGSRPWALAPDQISGGRHATWPTMPRNADLYAYNSSMTDSFGPENPSHNANHPGHAEQFDLSSETQAWHNPYYNLHLPIGSSLLNRATHVVRNGHSDGYVRYPPGLNEQSVLYTGRYRPWSGAADPYSIEPHLAVDGGVPGFLETSGNLARSPNRGRGRRPSH